MADSILGDIADTMKGALDNAAAPTGANGQLGAIISEAMEKVNATGAGINTEQMSHMLESLHSTEVVGADPQFGQVEIVEATPEAAANAATSSTAESEHATNALQDMAGKLSTIAESVLENVQTSDAIKGALDMEKLQEMSEKVLETMQQQHEVKVDAIENMRGDAGVNDGTLVAVAESGDAHAVVQADTDAGYDHAADHATVAPAHVDTTSTDSDGVA